MLAPLTEEEDVSDEVRRRRREEAVRRSQLYGISSAKRLPSVLTTPPDARIRRELQILVAPEQLIVHDGLSMYEDELEQRKHADHLGLRPALNQSYPLHDLYTTIPKQIHLSEHEIPHTAAKHSREWRVGYKNDPQSDFHGVAMRGVFEPTDTVRERILQADSYKQTSTALAYPTPFTTADQVAQELEPFDAEQARKDMEAKLQAGMVSATSSPVKKKHWSPASHAAVGVHNQAVKRKQKQTAAAKAAAMKIDQRFPVRRVVSPLKKASLATEPKFLQKQQALTQQLNESYASIQQQAKQQKGPTVRYSLPVENPKYERAYRLGLDPVASSPSLITQPQEAEESPEEADDTGDAFVSPQARPATKTAKKTKAKQPPLLFRPKSAVSLRLDTTLGASPILSRASSSTALLVKADTPGKVAGAKRRPHSATVNYLGHSTIFFMEPRSGIAENNASETVTRQNAHEVLKEQKKYGAQFLGVLLEERARRQQTHKQQLLELARRGVLHTIPTPQVFARLRREALKNITKRVEHARYEKLPLEEYMSLCGMAVVAGTPPKHHHTELLSSENNDLTSDDEDDEDEDGELIARPLDNHRDEDDESAVVQALQDQAELRNLPFDEPCSSSVVFRKRKSLRPDPANGNNSSTIQAMRKALFVTREQFHIALEAFALPARDVNLLFSALDVHVADAVAVWEIVCAVERLHDGHEELRRSRVQVKSRHLPKDLEPLRQSVSIPHRTHVPMPLW